MLLPLHPFMTEIPVISHELCLYHTPILITLCFQDKSRGEQPTCGQLMNVLFGLLLCHIIS